MRRTLLVALLLCGTGSLGDNPKDDFQREGTGPKREAKDALENKTPPALQVENWVNTDGKPLKLADLKGKVVVIDFWGVWCPPCRAAVPKLKDLLAKHKEQGLVVLGIHTMAQGEKMADFVKAQGLSWPCAVDAGGKTVAAYQVDSFPDYYLIDRSGKLRVADLVNADLERAIKVLLKEPAPK